MTEPTDKKDSIILLRRWITWAVVIGTTLWVGYFFIFLIYHSIVAKPITNNWIIAIVQKQPAATIGIAMAAISAFCLVAILEISRGKIEFEALGFIFRGASGPVIMWMFCFLVFIFGIWTLWNEADIPAELNNDVKTATKLLIK